MNSASRSDKLRFFWIICWLLFTVSFAVWWIIFSTEHIALLNRLQPEMAQHWQRQKQMIFWEGLAWIVLLVIGGVALMILVQKEKSRVRQIREFFASFSHEIKTSLASLRLQAEALKDESEQSSPILDRLIGDTVRLQVQLENSLFFASQDNLQLYLQPVRLSSLVERMREQWPSLAIEFNQDLVVRGDDRALRTIFSNLLQNALIHGRADRISIVTQANGDGRARITIQDNGSGYGGDPDRLGQLFYRPTPTSGSGLGLYICRLLIERMGGEVNEVTGQGGFRISFTLAGEAA